MAVIFLAAHGLSFRPIYPSCCWQHLSPQLALGIVEEAVAVAATMAQLHRVRYL
jgi:hypothetical protein